MIEVQAGSEKATVSESFSGAGIWVDHNGNLTFIGASALIRMADNNATWNVSVKEESK